jgi:hypothetical protein
MRVFVRENTRALMVEALVYPTFHDMRYARRRYALRAHARGTVRYRIEYVGQEYCMYVCMYVL